MRIVVVGVLVAGAVLAGLPLERATAAAQRIHLPNITKTLGGVAGWTTPIALQNTGPTTMTVTLDLYRFSDGGLVASIASPPLSPGRSWLFDPLLYPNVPDDTQFSVVATASGGTISAVVLEGSDTSAMSYSGIASGASTLYLPNVTRRLGGPNGWSTPFIVQNLGSSSATASVSFYRFADGTLVRRIDGVTLAPGRSQAFVPEIVDGLGDDSQYSVVVQGSSGAQLHAVVNEHYAAQAMSYTAQTGGAQLVYLPIVSKYVGGEQGWSSPFIVQNVGSGMASFSVAFYPLGTAQLVASSPDVTLAPGRAYAMDVRFTPAGLAPGRYSAAISGSFGAQLAAIVNQQELGAGRAMSYEAVPFSDAGPTAYLPYLTKSAGPLAWTSQVFIQNAAPVADLTITVYDASGSVTARRTFRAVDNGVSVLYDLATEALPSGTYSAVVEGSARVIAVVDHLGQGSGDPALSYVSSSGATLATGPTPTPTATLPRIPGTTPTPTPTATAAVPTTLEIAPTSVTINVGQTQQFTATVRDQLGRVIPNYPLTWRLTPFTLGSTALSGSSSLTFTAGASPSSGTVRAEAGVAYPNVYAQATIQVVIPPPVQSCSFPATGVRAYRTAIVPIVGPATSASDRSSLEQLASGIRDILPVYWASATECLSSMQMDGPETLVDGSGTILRLTGAADVVTASAEFYRTHTDMYDFLVFLPLQTFVDFNNSFNRPGPYGYPFGTPIAPGVARLLSAVRVTVTPTGLGSARASSYMAVLLHELHHQWCCIVDAPPGYGVSALAIHPDITHWSVWLNFPSRPKYPIVAGDASGWGWTANADGSYTFDCTTADPTSATSYRYPKIGLFLMGLIPSSQVPPLELLNGAGDPIERCISSRAASITYTGLTVTSIPIAAIVAANPWLANRP